MADPEASVKTRVFSFVLSQSFSCAPWVKYEAGYEDEMMSSRGAIWRLHQRKIVAGFSGGHGRSMTSMLSTNSSFLMELEETCNSTWREISFFLSFFFEKSKEQVAAFQELLNNPRIYWMRFSDWGWSAFNYFQISFLLDENEKWMRTDDYKTSPQFFPVFVLASKPTPLFPLQTLM